ncbi:MAG: DUF3857 domain-containing protein [Dysgonomonas sp.]
MKKYILGAILLAMSLYSHSQVNFTEAQGVVTQYEMVMPEYEKDKDAEALVIYDLGDYYFRGDDNRGFILYMNKRIKIKILKQAGIKEANFEIPYYIEGQDWENIESIEGTTYNIENGELKKTILTGKNIFEEKTNENIRVKKIAFSDVRVGSVIELNYVINTPYFFQIRKWEFQKNIPVVHSQLKYRAIPYYEYTYLMKGTNKFDEFESHEQPHDIRFGRLLYREMQYTFGMKELPAFRDEEFITAKEDYMIGINFQLSKYNSPFGGSKEIITTWPAMCDDFIKDEKFGKYIRDAEKEAKKIFPTLNLGNEAPIKQVEAITGYVKSNYNWNGFYGKYAASDLSAFLKQKTGNVGGLNLFLIGLLSAAKLDVRPVVISTRGNGVISRVHPFQQFFNYVIAQVVIDGKPYYIDATEPSLYFSDLPQRCINVEGLVIKPKTEEWVNITQKGISVTQKDFNLKIIPENNKIEVDAKFIGSGFSGYDYRTTYMGKKENLAKYLKDKSNIDVKGDIVTIENDKLNRPFYFSFNYDCPVEGTPDKLFISPFCNLSISDNPFKQTNRTLLVDLVYIRGKIYKSTIEIPNGYKIEHLPEHYTIDDDLIKVDYIVQESSNGISFDASYTLKKNIYPATDYIRLKMSFADIMKKFSEMLVLVKK